MKVICAVQIQGCQVLDTLRIQYFYVINFQVRNCLLFFTIEYDGSGGNVRRIRRGKIEVSCQTQYSVIFGLVIGAIIPRRITNCQIYCI